MKSILVKLFAILVLFYSCSSDDEGNSNELEGQAFIGTWQLTAINVSSAVDGDNDGDTSTNLLDEVDCLQETITINEIVVTPPTLANTSFCTGTSVSVDAGSGFTTYNWIPSGGNAQIGNFNQAGNYAVIVSSGVCSDTSNFITITALQTPSPQILGDLSYCNSDSTVLTANTTYDSYLWTPSNLTTSSITAGAGTITLTVDSNGCSATTSVVVTRPQASPQIAIPSFVCPGNSILVTATGGSFDSYLWSNGDTTSTTTASSGPISLTVTQNGCSFSTSGTVQTFASPTADFTISPEKSAQPNADITFTNASSSSATGWSWNFDATGIGSTSAEATGEGPFDWIYDLQGTYTITLTVVDANGCESSTSQDYLIVSDIIVPNVITPNGDNLNDLLVFQNLDPSTFTNKLEVFNRWGLKVHSETNYKNDWDGGVLSDGTYFYILEVDFNTGKETYKGSINILR